MAKKVEKEEVKEVKETKKEAKKETKVEPVKKEEKKSSVGYVVAVIVLIIIFVLVFASRTGKLAISLEDKLNKSLTNMGEDFYTEFYYPEISKDKSASEVSQNLERYKDIGIKINLDNLSRYNDGANKAEIAKFKNSNGKACNQTNTRAIIYPKSPYGKKDYTVKVELDCGFSDKTAK